ncbi:hypothetical protein [Catenuloplanes atrovinosus]|uniref:Uncharacterized protein n=1 Tax=Catenuloplanes atrovinosus TaxID=137266 RepID=A0AAE4CBP4_9ACTN|nr:hypothetical protein [Catenuloplanes atrovinosus]MDR7278861.1 hypothetical protein [Catenuloplanes atrovinosus]
MTLFLHAYAAVAARLTDLNRPENRDRGDSPVPTVIIIAGLAALAVAVLAWAFNEANLFMDHDTGNIPAVPN